MPEARVGFAGLGMIGLPMAMRLVKHGVRLTAFNRTPAKAEPVVAAGAEQAMNIAELVNGSDIVITCLLGPEADEENYLGPEGAFAQDIVGKLFVNTATIGPALASRLASEARARRAGYLDCPLMSGGPSTAAEGRMTIPVGGAAADLERARFLLDILATTVEHVGGPGAGQTVKVANNTLLAVSAAALSEVLRAAVVSGIDADALGRLLPTGSSRSFAMNRYITDMIDGTYRHESNLTTLAKDVALGVALAESAGQDAPIARAAAQRFRAALDLGLGGLDVPAVIEVGGDFRRTAPHSVVGREAGAAR